MNKTFRFFLMGLDAMMTEDAGRQKHFRLSFENSQASETGFNQNKTKQSNAVTCR